MRVVVSRKYVSKHESSVDKQRVGYKWYPTLLYYVTITNYKFNPLSSSAPIIRFMH